MTTSIDILSVACHRGECDRCEQPGCVCCDPSNPNPCRHVCHSDPTPDTDAYTEEP